MNSLPLQSHHIMEALTKRGHCVRVIDYEARWKPGGVATSLARRTYPGVHRTDQEASVTLIRPGMAKLPGIARLSAAASQFGEIFQQTIKWCDVIVLYSVPTNGIQTILSAKLSRKPVLFHSFDVLHRMTGYRLLSAPTWAMERLVYSQVNEIVVISAALETYMRDIGVPSARIVLLPPAVNMEKFNPKLSGAEFRKEIGLSSDDKIILFSGWLYEFCGVDVVMRSWKELSSSTPRLKLVVCGGGPLLEEIQKIRASSGLEDEVRILGRRAFDEMPQIIASADLCMNPYLPEVRSNYAFPSKLAEYMAMAKPVIATDLPGTRSLLPPDSGVQLVKPDNFVSSLREFLRDNQKLQVAGRTSREFCEKTFSLSHITDKFEKILEGLSNHQWHH